MSVSYEDYVKMQVYGEIIKPIHYHIGEWQAINYFLDKEHRGKSILDIGCGIGYGLGMMQKMGFKDVAGIDLNKKKIELGRRLGYNVNHKDILDLPMDDFLEWEIIWSSHSFEHLYNPDKSLEILKTVTSYDAKFFFILPYPDIDPSPVHHSTPIIGTNIQDEGVSVIKWFEDRGLILVNRKYDQFRESEIWLEFMKA